MRNQSIKVVVLAALLAIVMIFGSAGQAFAQPAVDKVDVLVSFKEKPGKAEHELVENAGGKVNRSYNIIPAVAASIPKAKLDALRRHPKVKSVEEDITVKAIEDTLPWGVDRIGAGAVHSQTTGRGVRVAVLDTGIDLDHPDLRVAGNVTFVPDTTSGDDDNGHGTMVAGIIAALDNGVGVVGVAPDVELYSVKVLNSNGAGLMSVIIAGLEWAIENNMQVINISFGGILNFPQAARDAFDIAYQQGTVIVAGAGNSAEQGVYAPARYDSVIAVGATDQSDARASFSSVGSTLELMAPGVGIQSTARGGSYGSGSGTSFSTPHVSGAAALLIASGITGNNEIRRLLQVSAKDLGTAGRDNYYGFGLVNVAAVLKADRNLDFIPPTTQIKLSGTPGSNGWYRSEVKVELTASDPAGVMETQYSLDSGRTWQKYAAPFSVTSEGITNVLAKSRDSSGNIEIPVRAQAKIDKTAPTVSITTDPAILWPSNHKMVLVSVNVAGLATDATSGVRSYQVTVKDEYGQIQPVIGAQLQSQIQLEAWREGKDLDGRSYTISLVAIDLAGNESRVETAVTVPHDPGKGQPNNQKAS